MLKGLSTIDDLDLEGKCVLVRIDVNLPYDEASGRIMLTDRMREHAKTIRELSEKGARVVVLAHQGRRGDVDFIHLSQHAELFTQLIRKNVRFIPDIIGEEALGSIASMALGDIVLLDNVRFLDEESLEKSPEEHARGRLVQALSPLLDAYVNDAFSTAHRAHASLVGFPPAVPSAVGRVMERELTAVDRAFNPVGRNIFIMGGAKPDDCLSIMQHLLKNRAESVKQILTCGVLGEIFMMAEGYDLGKPTLNYLEKKGYLRFLSDAQSLLKNYSDRIMIPTDVAVEEDGRRKELDGAELPVSAQILDIGVSTVERYTKVIEEAKTIVVKGPAGVYEKPEFQMGTKLLLEAVARSFLAFSLIGGGDSALALERLGFTRGQFSHVSLGGGALITCMSGKPMPAIDALRKYAHWRSLGRQATRRLCVDAG